MSAVTIPKADPDDTLDVLIKAREWLSEREHWTRGVYWRAGTLPTNDRSKVTCTCAEGALCLVSGVSAATDGPPNASRALEVALEELEGAYFTTIVNDSPDGYNRIMAGLDKAIATERKRRGLV